ncbi:hypothetical protein [Prauserella cavernicola]|uniref:hypothetical protein n=1 Tax=Prauserella cavernicola TaxID=2800127 RepID=UPI0027DD1ED2|nr:hypothetical protein [Prauserella cavernicola]
MGTAIGSLIAIGFGLVFVVATVGELPAGVALGIRIAGGVVAFVLAVAVLRVARGPVDTPAGDSGLAVRRYWAVAGAEGLALFGGIVVLNAVFDRPEFVVPWIAFVVGVHFVALAKVWRLALFVPLGAVLVVFGAAGAVLAAAGADLGVVGLVSGVCSGTALFGSVLAALAAFGVTRQGCVRATTWSGIGVSPGT